MLPITLLGMLLRTLPIAPDGTLPASLTVRSQASSQDALKKHSPARSQHPIAPDRTLPACLTIHSHVSPQDTPKYTPTIRISTLSIFSCAIGRVLESMPRSVLENVLGVYFSAS
jgi:hypothetical protein